MRRKLSAPLLALLLGAATAVCGCSGSAPLVNPSSPAAAAPTAMALATTAGATSSGIAAPPNPSVTRSSSVDASLSGLSAQCTAVIDGQVAIATLFAGPVAGHKLSKADVSKVFDALGTNIPAALAGDVSTLHDAATRSVDKSDVEVASILAEKKVADATAALSAFVRGCNPTTS